MKLNNRGFTLIEMMMTIILLTIISSIIFFSFNALNNKNTLDKQIDLVKNLINQTRVNALNSKNGVDQSIILGTTTIRYNNQNFDLNNGVELYSYNTSTSSIIFYRITGLSSATGTFVYALKKGGIVISTSSISINNLGIVE